MRLRSHQQLRVLAALIVGLTAAATVAEAGVPSPIGLWRIKAFDDANNLTWVGTQDICILSGGTWFSPSFIGWTGFWFQKGLNAAGNGDHVRLLGNAATPQTNDSAELDFTNVDLITGPWTEWSDDGSYKLWGRAMLCYIGTCAGPPPTGAAPTTDPLATTTSTTVSALTPICAPPPPGS